MKEIGNSLNKRIGDRVRELRAEQGVSLDALANRSGVSRSMLSRVERGESSPTATLLEKIASGLGASLASLFDPPAGSRAEAGPVARRENQVEWRDPATGYVRRNLSPPGVPQPMKLVEVSFPAKQRVAFETNGWQEHVHQQIWVIEGKLEVTVGEERHRLRKGDCLAMTLVGPTIFENRTRKPVRYIVVIEDNSFPRRR